MITAKETTKKIIGYIKNTEFNVPYNTMSNCELVTKKLGGYMLEFTVTYDQKVKNYISASYEQPEEYDISFTPKEINDVCVYVNNEILELNEDFYASIKNELENNILTL